MFLAKNSKGADKMGRQLRSRAVRKEYIARVKGQFPLHEITCNEPLLTVDPRVALNRVNSEGKEATTIFKRISCDGETSIIKCKPLTGRTHQIRVHLQYLGFPIANDPQYSNPEVWGPELGKDGSGNDEEISRRIHKIGKVQVAQSWIHQKDNHTPKEVGEKLTGEKCSGCLTELYTDPGPNDLDLWLHALKYYSIDNSNPWSYETCIPDWMTEIHKPFMEKALDEARKSTGTENAFSVGALLVKDGQILETGYTRELPGNTHAEQCALEKYFAKHNVNDVPEGSVIYTTMEPCSLRLSGNLPCVDRILQTSIKTVFVGVMEPDTFVSANEGKKKLEAAGVEYIHIPGLEAECLRVATKEHR